MAKRERVGRLFKKTVELSEVMHPGRRKGKAKKKWAVEFITKELNKRLDLPLLNEEQEAAVIGWAVDIVVDLVSDKVGLDGKAD
jgi:hypothetical protein|tara:strand:- start:120 stop:371 length:252 start_codon:yes stop_codon:yes gene_type:complete